MNRFISTTLLSIGGTIAGFTSTNLILTIVIFSLALAGGIFLGLDLAKDE